MCIRDSFKAVYNRGKPRLKTENTEGAIADLDKATSLKPCLLYTSEQE